MYLFALIEIWCLCEISIWIFCLFAALQLEKATETAEFYCNLHFDLDLLLYYGSHMNLFRLSWLTEQMLVRLMNSCWLLILMSVSWSHESLRMNYSNDLNFYLRCLKPCIRQHHSNHLHKGILLLLIYFLLVYSLPFEQQQRLHHWFWAELLNHYLHQLTFHRFKKPNEYFYKIK